MKRPTAPSRWLVAIVLMLVFLSIPLAATSPSEDAAAAHSLNHGGPALLVIQLAIIIFVSWIGGRLAKLVKMPAVVGQLFMGIIIGPFALGGLGLPGFPQGIFPNSGEAIPVSETVADLSSIAAIVLLFAAGLETDLALFKRYAAKGGAVGVGGVLVSFVGAGLLTSAIAGIPFFHPLALFMGTLFVATSVGISASILSSQRKIDSPEGTVILSAAVIDDILGIIILAVVVGITAQQGQAISAADVLGIVAKALGLWLVFTFLGLKFSRKISNGMKSLFHNQSTLAVMAFGLALLFAGVFESAGLSTIIGAYIVGLSLSNTDIAYVIQSKLKPIEEFLVPIFFAVSGMTVNLAVFTNPEVLGLGLLFSVVAIVTKLLGTGLPALAVGFNGTGAWRIGWGMVPKGEVALIIAAIGARAGILDERYFGVAIMVTLFASVLAPIFLSGSLKGKKSGVRGKGDVDEKTETEVSFGSPELAELLTGKFIAEMERDGFFVNRMEHEESMYQMRRDDVFITMNLEPDGTARFTSAPGATGVFQTALYESLLSVSETAERMKRRFKPKEMIQKASQSSASSFDVTPFLDPNLVTLHIKANEKDQIIKELVDIAIEQNFVHDEITALADILEREKSMSTGMQYGIAIPHAKTNAVSQMRVVVGLKPEGVDFAALDGQPSTHFFLILSPKEGYGPHLQLLAKITSLLNQQEIRDKMLKAQTPFEVIRLLGAKG